MNRSPEGKPALPLEELEISPQWVKAPPPSYRNHSGEDRPERFDRRGRRDNRERPRGRRPGGRNRPDRPREDRRGGEQGGTPPSRRDDPRKGRRFRGGDRGRPSREQAPPASVPPVEVSFIAEEQGLLSMLQAMREPPRAYALFDVAKLILNKPERHLVRLAKTPGADGSRAPMFLVVPSENPFLTQDEAVRFLLRRHADLVFKEVRTPVDPPKGNFAFVNRCGVTGALLGPPNYHEYQNRLVRHHQQRLPHMPFETFKSRIQTVKDPEAVKAWIEQMSFKREYQCLLEPCKPKAEYPKSKPQPAPAKNERSAVEGEVNAQAQPAAASDAPPAPATSSNHEPADAQALTQPGPSAPVVFSAREELEQHFVTTHLDKFVTAAPALRISGHASRRIEHRGILEAIRRTWEKERKYPLQTANGMRGRLRKEGFHFLKYKGITYISTVKPKRLDSLDGLTDSARRIVRFLHANPENVGSCNRKTLIQQLLPPQPVTAPAPTVEDASQTPSAGTVSPEQERLLADLHWLIMEGYVIEFSDGRLWAPEDRPPQLPPAPAKKESAETSAPTATPGEETIPRQSEANLGEPIDS